MFIYCNHFNEEREQQSSNAQVVNVHSHKTPTLHALWCRPPFGLKRPIPVFGQKRAIPSEKSSVYYMAHMPVPAKDAH